MRHEDLRTGTFRTRKSIDKFLSNKGHLDLSVYHEEMKSCLSVILSN